jgi:uncharacterized RDD family membrane protein YckC
MQLPDGLIKANKGRRAAGYILDLVGFVIVVAILGTIFQILGIRNFAITGPILGLTLYYGLFWALRGQTPGQQLLGLHVVSRSNPLLGGIGFPRAFRRVIGYAICSTFPFNIGLLFDLHDKIAGTIVVQQVLP